MSKDILMPLRRLHGWLHEYPAYCAKRKELLGTYVSQLREQLRRQPKSVFLVMTPEHGNLGDHAIASAEIRMLREAGIDYIEVTDRQLKSLYCTNLLSVMNGYPIIINGGGNMGTLWFDVERLHRAVIRSNPKSPIFIFPNTIYYEDSDWGAEEFRNSIRIYNRHRSLFLYAREKLSYEVMKDAYRNVKLVPDIVLSLDESGRDTNRQGCLLCLRRDLEKIRTGEQEQLIRDQATELFGNAVRDTDMVVPGDVPVARREEALEQKYAEFAAAELVITDRLHGMIFCAITGTPCIVVDSRSPKVRGCYEWVKTLDFIRFVEDPARIAEVYHQIPQKKGGHPYNNSWLLHYFKELQKDVKEYAHYQRHCSSL